MNTPEDLALRKTIVLFLVVLMMLPLIPALTEAQPAEHLVSIMGYEPQDSYRIWQDNLFFSRMQQRTGIMLEFMQEGDLASYHQKLLGFSADDPALPQVLFKANLSPQLALVLREKGLLVDLGPHLQEHAPNFYRLMEEKPVIRKAITLQDGSIPALPFLAQTPAQNILWINRDWVKELKLEMPTTAAELEALLLAFKTRDPNRNGRQDEIPLSFIGPYDLKYLAHAHGLAANDFNIYVEDGQVQFMPLQPGFADFLAWAHSLYQAGLLDQDGFTTVDSLRRVTDAKGSNRYGAFFAPLPTNVVPVEWTAQYQAMLPLSYQGKTVYRDVASTISFGTFALTASCRNIAEMLFWVDYLYTEEGSVLAGIGREGEDYVVDGDGSWRLLREAGDRGYFSQVIIATDETVPGIASEDFQLNYIDTQVKSLTEQSRQVAALSSLPFPDIPFTQEELDRLAHLQAQIGKYVDESIGRFVLGEWETTPEQFDLFRQELKALGADQLTSIFQEMLDKENR